MSQETIFDKVRFRNFQSFGNQWTEIILSMRGTTLIIGENLDEGGSSGAGKTTAMSVVSYCLYDKIPSGVSKDKMVNTTNGKKNTSMEAELYFHKGTNHYLIKRSRGQNTGVQLFENGKDITPASVTEVNAKVEELIGFSYNLFSQIVLFSGNSRPFLDLSVGDQRALIEELFKITVLTRKAVALKKQASETNKEIDLMKVLIKQQETQNEGYRKRLAEADKRAAMWDISHADQIKSQESIVEAIKNIDFDTEEQLHERITEIDKLVAESNAAIKQLNVEVSAKRREKHPLSDEFDKKNRELDRLSKDSTKIQTDLGHLVESKCPYCLQDYAAAKTKIADLEKQLEDNANLTQFHEAEINDLVEVLEKFRHENDIVIDSMAEQIRSLTESVKNLSEEREELAAVLSFKTYKDHANAKAGIQAAEDKLLKMKAEPNPHLEALETLEREGEITIDYESLDKLVVLKEHQSFMAKLLTDKNSFVRKNLISTTTPFLNKRIGYYLEKLNLPHVVLFQPDMSCEITQLGRSLDHGNLSNGEKKRLNLALCLSFRDVLTYLHSKVNVLFVDEVDGGSLCSQNINSLIQVLKKKAWDDDLSIFCISHAPDFEGRLDRSIVVRKEQGFSTLIHQID